MSAVAQSLKRVKEGVEQAARRAGRNPQNVRLVAVTKEAPLELIMQAIEAGHLDFGENRAQDFLLKHEALLQHPINWHFIGYLQRNKVKKVLGKVVLIQSVDRFSLAQEIEKQASKLGIVQEVLVEVNIAGEASKHGLPPAQVAAFLDQIEPFSHLKVRGLMTIAPWVKPAETRPYFEKMRKLFEREKTRREFFDILSMGMSNDFEVAIEEGSTMVRIGSAIFKQEAG
jgi:hypothetical protein